MSGRVDIAARNAGTALACWLAGQVSFLLDIPPAFMAPVWLPAAVALVAVMRWGFAILPGIGIGVFAVCFQYGWTIDPRSVTFVGAGAAGAAASSMLQAALARILLRRWDGRSIETGRDISAFVLLGGAVPAFVAAALLTGVFMAGDYLGSTSPAIALMRLWVSCVVAVAACAPLLIVLTDRHRVSARRKWTVGLPAILMLAITVLAFGLVREGQREARETRFSQIALEEFGGVDLRVDDAQRRLTMLDALFAGSEEVTQDELRAFVDVAFAGFDAAGGLFWSPVIELDAAGGLPADTPLDLAGQAMPRPAAEDYLVVPLSASDRIVQRAVATRVSAPDLAATVNRAVASGQMAASSIQVGPSGTRTVVLTSPAFANHEVPDTPNRRRRAMIGLALGAFDVDSLIDDFGTRNDSFYRLRIEDLGPRPDNGPPLTVSPLQETMDLAVGDRTWRMTYSATTAFLVAYQDWLSWITLVLGLSFVALLIALILLATARTDLVERLVNEKTAEARRLSDNLALILEHAADGIISTDPQGRCIIVNRAAADLLGYEPEELQDRCIHDLIHPVDRADHPHDREDCPMVIALSEGPVRWGMERFFRKDGTSFSAEYSSEQIRAESGRVLGVVTIMRDITEREAAEAERQRFVDGLVRANEELERFAFVASHDLQEPLRLIANFTSLLLSRCGDQLDERATHYAERSAAAAARMQTLITDLLAYGRLNGETDWHTEEVELSRVVADAQSNLREPLDKAGARIEVGPLPTVTGSRSQLLQLMQNLIGNAAKYRTPERAPVIHISADDIGDAWQIDVADNGIGIKADYRSQVFQPFKRLHSHDEFPGTGMGLAICRKIVETHSGVIEILDNEPSGTLVRFTLPKQSRVAHASSA